MVLLNAPMLHVEPTPEESTSDHDSSRRILLGAAATLAFSALASSAQAKMTKHGAHHSASKVRSHAAHPRKHTVAPHSKPTVIRPHTKYVPHAAAPRVYRPSEVHRFSHFVRTPEVRASGARVLSLYVANTGERASAMYWEDGEYIPAGLREISYLLRDYRTDSAVGIAPDLLDYLHGVTKKVSFRQSVNVVSGYRSPRTNEMLRHHQDGVARNSYHTKGRAVDVVMPGVDLRYIRNAALHIAAGGVGYYPDSGFVHLDSGPRRSWNG